ncbi:MAG: IS6 family transposase [Alphaproteobacteria bacterium]|nr:IS6 family transposase [Alphaproteobacteria bacterium]
MRFVSASRSAKTTLRFFKKLLKGLKYVPRLMITDKLKSYKAARKKLLKITEHRNHKKLNNVLKYLIGLQDLEQNRGVRRVYLKLIT